MKIAVLFAGRISADAGIYKNLMDSIIGPFLGSESDHQPTSSDVDFFICYQKGTSPEVVEKVISLYQPKKIIENDEIHFPVDHYRTTIEYELFIKNAKNRIMYMFRGRRLVSAIFEKYLQETSEKYDIVIFTRMDLYYSSKISTEKMHRIAKDVLFIPSPEYDYRGINDQLAFGNINTIITYLKLYDYLFEILEDGVILNPEIILLTYLIFLQQKVERIPLSYVIIRNNDLFTV
jgi:hypothetical protein